MDLQNMLRFQLMGGSANLRPVNQLFPGLQTESPTMLMGRMDVNLPAGFRAGMAGQLIQLPDGRFMRMPGPVDVGYSAPFLGGNLDANYSQGPNNQQRGMLTYRRSF